jgi:hypothetical protein
MKWGNLSKLLGQVSGAMEEDGFFFAPGGRGEGGGGARRYQRGALRTNCLDNLDRTNVVQSVFARAAALVLPGLPASAFAETSEFAGDYDVGGGGAQQAFFIQRIPRARAP